jgi:hypothetical protein
MNLPSHDLSTLARHAGGVILLVTTGALATACVAHRQPPPAPDRAIAAIELPRDPPSSGTGRVVLDTVDRPSVVYSVNAAWATTQGGGGVVGTTLCATPCFVDLPYGRHDLYFADEDDRHRRGNAIVDVQADLTYVRSHLGRNRDRRTRGLNRLFVLAGGVFGIVGGALWTVSSLDAEAPALMRVGRPVTIGSLVSVATGVVLWMVDRPVRQRSSTTVWRPTEDPVAPAPVLTRW